MTLDRREGVKIEVYNCVTGIRLRAVEADGTLIVERPAYGFEEALFARCTASSIAAITERTAQIAAHRVCCGTEHDAANGKLHGYCVVCGVPWPCQYAGTPPSVEGK